MFCAIQKAGLWTSFCTHLVTFHSLWHYHFCHNWIPLFETWNNVSKYSIHPSITHYIFTLFQCCISTHTWIEERQKSKPSNEWKTIIMIMICYSVFCNNMSKNTEGLYHVQGMNLLPFIQLYRHNILGMLLKTFTSAIPSPNCQT